MQTYNHLGRKGTHLAKLAKWLSCVGSTYLYGAFDCILSSCHVCDSAWIHTVLPERQGTRSWKLVRYLKFKWLQRDSNPQSRSSWTNIQPFTQTGQLIELCYEYLSVRWIWLYVIMSRARLPKREFLVEHRKSDQISA